MKGGRKGGRTGNAFHRAIELAIAPLNCQARSKISDNSANIVTLPSRSRQPVSLLASFHFYEREFSVEVKPFPEGKIYRGDMHLLQFDASSSCSRRWLTGHQQICPAPARPCTIEWCHGVISDVTLQDGFRQIQQWLRLVIPAKTDQTPGQARPEAESAYAASYSDTSCQRSCISRATRCTSRNTSTLCSSRPVSCSRPARFEAMIV